MIVLPPRHYCIIKEPVRRDADGNLVHDHIGQVKNQHGEEEVRFHRDYQQPFSLYPREKLKVRPTPLTVIQPD